MLTINPVRKTNTIFDIMAGREIVDDGIVNLVPTVRIGNGKRIPDKHVSDISIGEAEESWESGHAIIVNDGRHITIERDRSESDFGVKLEQAYWFGFNAYKRGLKEYPSQDRRLFQLVCESTSDKHSDLMESWRDGYTTAARIAKYVAARHAQAGAEQPKRRTNN